MVKSSKKFIFSVDGQEAFRCNLTSLQCAGHAKNGARCRKRCVIGLPMCWIHTQSQMHLKVKPSLVEGAGMGLFAWDPTRAIVFKNNDLVCEYLGEQQTIPQRIARYGHHTGPYSAHLTNAISIDASCKRGTGSLINHAPGRLANVRLAIDARNRKINIRADRNIMHDQELKLNYGSSYVLGEEGVHHRTT